MRSETSSVYSAARTRTGTSTSATSHTTEATLDTTQLYHGGRPGDGGPARRAGQRLVREHPPALPAPRRSPFDDVTGTPPGGALHPGRPAAGRRESVPPPAAPCP